MEKQFKKVYWVILSDMVSSKKVEERLTVFSQLRELLADYPQRYEGVFFAPPVSSKGIDEISTIIEKQSAIPEIIFDLAINLHPRVLRFGIAKDEISPISRIATEADGPAFHRAASNLQTAENSRRLFSMSQKASIDSSLVQIIFHQVLTLISSWPESTAQMARTKWRNPEMLNESIAKKFKVSPQAVSKNLRRSRLDEVRESLEVLNRWFASQQF